MKVDLFFRSESNRRNPKEGVARSLRIEMPETATLPEILAEARKQGMPGGSHRTGCFEVQTDLGVWSHQEENRIDLSTPVRAAKVRFSTWEELELAS